MTLGDETTQKINKNNIETWLSKTFQRLINKIPIINGLYVIQ